MKDATWDRLLGTIIDQCGSKLREESDNLRELYAIRKRMRADNGQTRKKFSFPISIAAKISSEGESDFEVTVQISASAGRAASETKDVHAPDSEFFGQEGEARIGHAMKANGKARRKGKKEVEAGGETAVVDLETNTETRDITHLFLEAGIETGMEATLTIMPSEKHPEGFDFAWWLRLERDGGVFEYPDGVYPDAKRSWPTAAAALEQAQYTLLSRLQWEIGTQDARLREACSKAVSFLLREWKRAESAMPKWDELVAGDAGTLTPETEEFDLDEDLADRAQEEPAPAATARQERMAEVEVEQDMRAIEAQEAQAHKANEREVRKAAKKGRRGKTDRGTACSAQVRHPRGEGTAMQRLRIKGWDDHYESSTTRRIKSLTWVPVPNRHDGDAYTELMEHENGAAHLGAWLVILQVASKCDPRGVLVKGNGKAHTPASIARMTRFPKAVLEEAIPRLIEIGWLEQEAEAQEDQASPTSDNGPRTSNNGSATKNSGRLNDVQLSRARAEGKGMEGKGREQKGRKEARARAPDPPADPPAEEKAKVAYTIPIEGGNAAITEDHVAFLAEAFPEVDVPAAIRQIKCHYQAPGVRLQSTESALLGRIRRWISEDLKSGKAPLKNQPAPEPPPGWQRPKFPVRGGPGPAEPSDFSGRTSTDTMAPAVTCGECGWLGMAFQAMDNGECPECGAKTSEAPLDADD